MDINEVGGEVTVISAGVIGMITMLYKFLRILKSDKKTDSLDKEEKDFRTMLLAELKELRLSNQTLLIEKSELLARISSLEVELEWLRKHLLKLEATIS